MGEVCDVDDMLIDLCPEEKKKKTHTSTSNPVPCSKRQRLQSETPAGRPNELPARLALSEGCHGWLRIPEMVFNQLSNKHLENGVQSFFLTCVNTWSMGKMNPVQQNFSWRVEDVEGFYLLFGRKKLCVFHSSLKSYAQTKQAWFLVGVLERFINLHRWILVSKFHASYEHQLAFHPSQLGVFGDQCSLIFRACHVLVHHHHHHHHRKNCISLETNSSGAAIVSWWRLLMRKAQVLRRNW